mmetsp:Transcript_11871/g.26348  ORF Transcript_11871/g.26348 Transcript_11871/m.26348 type:complete len:417 (-) Transcript_11871:145-1395(-)
MPTVDLAVGTDSYIYTGLDIPAECTVGKWKQLVLAGHLGDKILYANRLTCHEAEKGGRQLQDADALPEPPEKMYIEGPASVVKMLELALKKKLGPPTTVQRIVPRPSILQSADRIAPPAAGLRSERLVYQQQRHSGQLKYSGGDDVLAFYCSGVQGMRPHMEDRTCGVVQLEGKEHAGLFGVFDGHGGHEVAENSSQNLPRVLAGCLQTGEPSEALRRSFRLMDEELWTASSKRQANSFERVGSTCVVVLVLREAGSMRLLCANCGDSRAVLCRKGHAMDLSVDQKPQNPEERRRIEAAGGRVELFGPCWRIDAGLNLSRSLGDFAYKANPAKSASEQKVIADPELKEVVLEKGDEFVVMGSDGVFDVLSSEALVQHLRESYSRLGSWPAAIESALARSLPGGDNVTLCLVHFLHP